MENCQEKEKELVCPLTKDMIEKVLREDGDNFGFYMLIDDYGAKYLDEVFDIDKMRQAAEYLTGKHDYKSFCGNSRMKKSTVRVVDKIEIVRRNGYVYMTFHGTGFLQNMVRILVGTLMEVGYGRMEPEYMVDILEAKDRKVAGPTAPAKGLCLIEVDY